MSVLSGSARRELAVNCEEKQAFFLENGGKLIPFVYGGKYVVKSAKKGQLAFSESQQQLISSESKIPFPMSRNARL